MKDQQQIAVRAEALKWFRSIPFTKQKELMKNSSNELIALPTRMPETLTGREIEILWKENES